MNVTTERNEPPDEGGFLMPEIKSRPEHGVKRLIFYTQNTACPAETNRAAAKPGLAG